MDKYQLQYDVGRALRWLAHISLDRVAEVYDEKTLKHHGRKATPHYEAIVKVEEGLIYTELIMLDAIIAETAVKDWRVEDRNSSEIVSEVIRWEVSRELEE